MPKRPFIIPCQRITGRCIKVLNDDIPLVACKYFKTHLLDIAELFWVDVKSKDEFMSVIYLEGQRELHDSERNVVAMKLGETVLILACNDTVAFTPFEVLKLMTCWG